MAMIVKDRSFDPERPLFFEGPRLYELARTDIPQMNPGKLGAQSHHAGTKLAFEYMEMDDKADAELKAEIDRWRNQADGYFGTVITLAATEAEIMETLAEMDGRYNFHTGTVIDPTYPMMNYFKVPFTRPELTCGYVFVPHTASAGALEVLKKFDLHP